MRNNIIIICSILFFSSCSKENIVNENINNSKSLTTNFISDRDIEKMAELHNDYLEIMVRNFDYQASDYVLETRRCFLSEEIELLSNTEKKAALMGFDERSLKKSNGANKNLPPNFEDLIEVVNNSGFDNSQRLVYSLESAYAFIDQETMMSCDELAASLDNILEDGKETLEFRELVVLKSFIQTMKASSRFWFPIELGGNGIGDEHLRKIRSISKLQMPWYGQAALSDCFSMGAGMVGVAIAGACGPVGWLALALVAGEAIVSSGLSGAI
ncbi:MAG: hypothetical protein PHI32_13960 [Dysgonamonadaceae bacterium]|nr:hypothetical protein [Dysgonamonadaceae bacterium]